MPVDTAVTGAVRAVGEKRADVLFAYVFGSLARGTARPGSDVDVAVYLDPEPDLETEASLHAELTRTLHRDDVDLIVLNHAPLWLQFRIVGEGTVVFSRDERRRVRHREEVERRFLDFKPYHDRYLAAVRERARGKLSG